MTSQRMIRRVTQHPYTHQKNYPIGFYYWHERDDESFKSCIFLLLMMTYDDMLDEILVDGDTIINMISNTPHSID